MLYIFDGLSQSPNPHGLHAGGLQYCIEEVEELGEIVHDPAVQYRKEGVFSGDEMLYPVEYLMSESLLAQGITWDWFPEDWAFGNGVTKHNTKASPDFKVVVHGTDLDLEGFLAAHGTTNLAEIELERMHIKHESWQAYESRWLPGTCPQEAHMVQLLWLITPYKLPEFAYERIRAIVEDSAELKNIGQYTGKDSDEPGKHFSESRRYDGNPIYRGTDKIKQSI